LIYSSSASTSPGHSAGTPADLVRHAVINDANFNTGRGVQVGLQPRGRAGHQIRQQQAWNQQQQQGWQQQQQQHGIQEEVYAYAATDFSQAEPSNCRPVPASVKSREYIMAKIADYTERTIGNQV